MSDRASSTMMKAVACALACVSATTKAVDIRDVQFLALDQPQVDVTMYLAGSATPLSATDVLGDVSTSFTAFLDTGASGIVLSDATADAFGVPRARFPDATGSLITHNDVGIGGTAVFNVSELLDFQFSTTPSILDPNPPPSPRAGATLSGVRAEVGPLGVAPSPFGVGAVNIVGMPVMRNKVVVLDPKPLDDLSSGMRSYIYDPATPFDANTAGSDPGVPTVGHHIQLSFASFDNPSLTSPPGAPGPTFADNPMIGSNQLTPQRSPGVTIAYQGKQATGSFLLDTGAQSSFISSDMAQQLGIRNKRDANGQILPDLEWFDPTLSQYVDIAETVLPLGGIGGAGSLAGFNLSSLLVRTSEGNASDDSDPNHLRFLDAPVFINDISVVDPTDSSRRFTIDGVLGMNFLVASILFDPSTFTFGPITPGAFNWLVLDMVNGQLGFDLKAAPVPLPSSLILLLSALTIALRTSRKAQKSHLVRA